MIVLLIVCVGSLLFLTYLENPAHEENRMINHLVRESLKLERSPKRNRAFQYAQVGWRVRS